MSKYIDAEKFLSELNKRMGEYDVQQITSEHPEYEQGAQDALYNLKLQLASLQQEQETQFIEINGIRYKEVPAKTNDKICKYCDYFLDNGSCNFDDCPCTCDDNILERIQQEQPKFKVGDTIHKIGENTVFPMTIERISDGDYVCDGGKCFVSIKFQDYYEHVEQEQPADGDDGKFVKISVRREFVEQFQRLGDEIQALQSSFIGAMNQQECIYGRTLEEREKACKYCSALCEVRIEQEQQKQLEVDLEKDAVQFCFDKGLNVTLHQAKMIARHFYELGLNARKEE